MWRVRRLSSLFSAWPQRPKNMALFSFFRRKFSRSLDSLCHIYIVQRHSHIPCDAEARKLLYEEILENLRFSIQSRQVGSPRYSYGDAVADVIRVRCGSVLNASPGVE